MKNEDIAIIEYDARYSHEAVAMWRCSKEMALGVKDIHSFDDHMHFLNTKLAQENKIYLAIDRIDNTVVGLMAIAGSELNQLYVHVDYQRLGVGTRLVNLAKQLSAAKLQLFTFEVNAVAQSFYERHGFKVIGRGCENEEKLPDVRYEWIGSDAAAT